MLSRLLLTCLTGALFASTLPAAAGAVAVRPVSTPPALYGIRIAPGPGPSVWTLMYNEIALVDRSGTVRARTPVDSGSGDTPLAGSPEGGAWFGTQEPAGLSRIAPDGSVRHVELPASLATARIADIDVTAGGVVWATAVVPGPDSGGTTYAVRADASGAVLVSDDGVKTGRRYAPAPIAATDAGDVWIGTACGLAAVQTNGHDIHVGSSCTSDEGDVPRALRHDPNGVLWTVRADGAIQLARDGKTRTVAKTPPASTRVDLAFTGSGPAARTWVQSRRQLVELAANGKATIHPLPRKTFAGEQDTTMETLTADGDGGLWMTTDNRLQRVFPDRCIVPRVVGLPASLARTALRVAGCRSRIHAGRSRGAGPALIVGQVPSAGSERAAGATVAIERAHTSTRCAVDLQHAVVTAQNRRWVVRTSHLDEGPVTAACKRSTGRWWKVADAHEGNGDFDTSNSGFQLQGDFLGYLRDTDTGESHEYEETTSTLLLADLVHRRRTRVTAVGTWGWSDGLGGGDSDVTGVKFDSWSLNAHGDVVWLEPHAVQLLRHGTKTPTTLATDPAATFAALHITADRVSWTQDGMANSKTL